MNKVNFVDSILKQEFEYSLYEKTICILDYKDKYVNILSDLNFINEIKIKILNNVTYKDLHGRLALVYFFNKQYDVAKELWDIDRLSGRMSWFQSIYYALCCLKVNGLDYAVDLINKLYIEDQNARNGYSLIALDLINSSEETKYIGELLQKDYEMKRMRNDILYCFKVICFLKTENLSHDSLQLSQIKDKYGIDLDEIQSIFQYYGFSFQSFNFVERLFVKQQFHNNFFIETKEYYANKLYKLGKTKNALELMESVYKDKYNDWKDNKSKAYLDRVNFEITAVCNLKCQYCSFANGLQQRYIEVSLFEKVLKEIATSQFELKELALYMSGESLLHPNFIEILHIVKKIKNEYPSFNPHTYMHTNGVLWEPSKTDQIISTGALDRVVWSIDGFDEQSFERMRPGAKYHDVLNKFEYFMANKKNVIGAINNLYEPIDIDKAKDSRLINVFQIADQVYSNPPRNLNKNDLNAPVSWIGSTSGLCSYVFNTAIITTSGQLSLCCVDYNSENAFGDLYKNTFEDEYFSLQRQKLLDKMYNGYRSELKGCKNCSVFHAGWFNN